MAKHFLKDKKITILEKYNGRDEYGLPIEELRPVAENIWAYYRHATGKEIYVAAMFDYVVEVVFKINWRDDIRPGMIIRFRDQDYGITRVDDFEGYKEDLTIYAYRLEKRG